MGQSLGSILLVLVIYVLAVARASRIVTTDKISEPFRGWFVRRYGQESAITYIWWCRWCISIWIGFAFAPAAIALTGLSWWLLPFVALTASHLTGLLAGVEE